MDDKALRREAAAAADLVGGTEVERTAILHRIDMAQGAYEVGELTPEDYFATLKRLRRQLRVTERALGEAESAYERAEAASGAQARWDSWTHEERRAFIKSRLAGVMVNPTSKRGKTASIIEDGEVILIPRTRLAALGDRL